MRGTVSGTGALSVGAVVLAFAWAGIGPAPEAEEPAPAHERGTVEACVAGVPGGATSPEFYEIDLVPTGNVPGTGNFRGVARVTFEDSPFDVAVSKDGAFHRRIEVDMAGVKQPESGGYVVWVSPPDLDPVKKLGVLGSDGMLTGDVSFTKYLVIVTLEENPEEIEGRWQGPVVHRGMSKSGFLHGMAGHGPFRQEPCANYGFQ